MICTRKLFDWSFDGWRRALATVGEEDARAVFPRRDHVIAACSSPLSLHGFFPRGHTIVLLDRVGIAIFARSASYRRPGSSPGAKPCVAALAHSAVTCWLGNLALSLSLIESFKTPAFIGPTETGDRIRRRDLRRGRHRYFCEPIKSGGRRHEHPLKEIPPE